MPGYVTVKFPKRKVNEKFPKAIRKKKKWQYIQGNNNEKIADFS